MKHLTLILLLSALCEQALCESCGGNLTASKGWFSTPRFPFPYPANSNCEWYIATTPPNVITVTFSIFRIENPSIITGNCDYDVLHVFDGGIREKLLGSICGAANPGTLVSTGSIMGFVFISDDSVSHQGFNATYSTGLPSTRPPMTTPRARCGTSITSDLSWITSPRYPSNYDNLLDCVYVIHLETGGKIAMDFVDIDIESSSSCSYDFLEVRDGDSSRSELLGRYCGTSAGHVIGSGDALYLRFVTDESVNKRGFNVTWSKAYCENFGGTCQSSVCNGDQLNLFCEGDLTCCRHQVLPKQCGVTSLDPPPLITAASPLIVGGQGAERHAWPWQVSLQDGSYHYCGGSLISDQWVLTAAHCVSQQEKVDVVLGQYDFRTVTGDEIRMRVSKVILHESFKSDLPYPNDLALLKLPRPVTLGKAYLPVCLPGVGEDQFGPGDQCYFTGWGQTKDTGNKQVLNQVPVSVRPLTMCRQAWGETSVRDTNICAGDGDTGACKGDYGGPLVCRRSGRWVLAGVSSWGKVTCQQAGYPDVCTRVSSYREWIVDKMTNN